jgi:hypothetical protein
MRLLTLDIETSPNLAYVWGLWDQNVGLNQIAELGSVICFAAKWYGEKKVHYHSDHHDGHAAMVQAAWDLIDQADAVIHYNGKAFDITHLNREFVLAGLAPPSAHKDIDLLTVARGRFKFASNKLEHVASTLGIGHKLHHSGFSLWIGCMKDDPKSWATMRKYNILDVLLTEQVYERLRPWVRNHPNVTLYEEGVSGCPTCGEKEKLTKRGLEYTRVSVFQRWQCQACRSYSRTTHREKAANRVPA